MTLRDRPLPRAAVAAAALAATAAACHVPIDEDEVRRRTERMYGPGAYARGEAVAGAAAAGSAQRPGTEKVLAEADLDTYLRYGLYENAGLRAAFARWRAAVERIPQASSLPDPVFGFTWFVEEIQTRTGPQERRYSLSQTLPWFGKLALRGDVAGGAAEEQWQAVVAKRLAVERDITVAYHEYGYLAESIRITADVLDLLRQLESVVQLRITGGRAGQEDLLRLQVEIGRVDNDLASYRQVRASLSARLAAAMNLRSGEALPLPDLPEPPASRQSVAADVDALMQRAEELNPELRGLAERVAKSRDARDLAGLQRYPDITLGVDYLETGEALAPTRGSGDDPVGVRLMFNLPIWGAKYAAAEREAEHEMEAARYALADRRTTLRADLEHAAFQLDDASRQVTLYGETLLPRAREALEVTRASYRAGRAQLLDLIDSERALLQFETGYWRACRDYHQSRARLEALVGGSL